MPTLDEFERRSCLDKASYKRRGTAWEEANRLGCGNQVYECVFHKHFHVGRPISEHVRRQMVQKLAIRRKVDKEYNYIRDKSKYLNHPRVRKLHHIQTRAA